MKTDKLEFYWDKDEQKYSEQHKFTLKNNNQKRDIEGYFIFLSEIEPGYLMPNKERPVNKQFTLQKI